MSERTDETGRHHRLALVSHDIRSALSDVVGGLDLVDASSLDSASRVQLERARAAGESLARLVDDAVSALTDDPMPSHAAAPAASADTVVLADLVRDLERRWSGHAAAHGLSLRIDLAPSVPLTAGIAAGPLERLLSNLLDNALKYAERGVIVLSVDIGAEGALRFTVQDEGPGFSDASLERLFGFAGRPPGSAQPGTGMGLHIAKSLADQMGGRIEAGNVSGSSGEGRARGACVAFLLPARHWQPDGPGREDAAAALPDLSGRCALVADDATTNQAVLARMLGRLGARVDTVGDGEAALAALTRGGYDLAILDVHMPCLSGPQVIAAVRRLPGPHGRVPILAATAYVLQGQREEIYAAGADGLIAKPVVSLAALGEAVARIDRGSDAPRLAWHGAAACGAAPDASSAAPLLSHLLALAGPDEAEELLDRLAADLERSAGGLAAAAARHDAGGVRAATHVLISLTGAVGAEGLQHDMEAANAAAQRDDWADIQRRLDAAAEPLAALRRTVAEARGSAPGTTREVPTP